MINRCNALCGKVHTKRKSQFKTIDSVTENPKFQTEDANLNAATTMRHSTDNSIRLLYVKLRIKLETKKALVSIRVNPHKTYC